MMLPSVKIMINVAVGIYSLDRCNGIKYEKYVCVSLATPLSLLTHMEYAVN
jgi:hypothetical protein